MMSVSAARCYFKMTLNCCCLFPLAPLVQPPLNTPLENVPVYSEALLNLNLNKPDDRASRVGQNAKGE